MNNGGCALCPVNCGALRTVFKGACGETSSMRIAKYYLHPYEEPVISGKNGSGAIFFSGCCLKCVFCQNYELSRSERGKEISAKELADIFRFLEDKGAHNINLVNPTHFSEGIIKALKLYKPKIPVVYNTHGYERTEILKEVNDYVDVYLPDIKFFSPALSARYCGKNNYFQVAFRAIKFMTENKTLVFGQDGLIKSGVIVRHLVLPQCVSDSKKILDRFAEIKDKAYINIMSQYTPFGNIENFPELNRRITKREYESVIDYAISLGIENAFYQDFDSQGEEYIPKWDY